ncbi:MAG: hypothetical protein QOD75_3481 [Blastocatellia bacterium]|nr:hypothetical protein [Blastocatellia bacterium]
MAIRGNVEHSIADIGDRVKKRRHWFTGQCSGIEQATPIPPIQGIEDSSDPDRKSSGPIFSIKDHVLDDTRIVATKLLMGSNRVFQYQITMPGSASVVRKFYVVLISDVDEFRIVGIHEEAPGLSCSQPRADNGLPISYAVGFPKSFGGARITHIKDGGVMTPGRLDNINVSRKVWSLLTC